MRLSDYRVDRERGFLPPSDPLDSLPSEFDAWEATAQNLSALLISGRLRREIEAWPTLPTEALSTRLLLERAMLLLSLTGGAYVWAESEPASTIPSSLAVPWCAVASKLERPPIISHASLVLNNWRRLDDNAGIELTNLATQAQVLGGMDESWFYLVTVAIEAEGAKALPLVAELAEGETRPLPELAPVLERLTPLLRRMRERCDPWVFYHRVRPFLAGWPASGVVYDGVWDEPKVLAGGSAAQSSLLQAVDAALDIDHPDERSGPFLAEMRKYMPAEHRAFLNTLDDAPSLRERIQGTAQLKDAYDRCVDAVEAFRAEHLAIVHDYISKPAEAAGQAAVGTGGTAYGQFLSQTREETKTRRFR